MNRPTSSFVRVLGARAPLLAAIPFAIASLLVASPPAFAAGAAPSVTVATANRAFAEGRYGEAASDFERLVKDDGPSSALLFDLGNAYLRDGKPAPAILAYERAELLSPHDPAIATNLAAARAAAGVAESRGPLERAARFLPIDAWTWLAAGSIWIALGAAAFAAFARRRRSSARALAIGAGLVAVISSAGLFLASPILDEAVVTVTAPVLVSPFDTAQSQFALTPGTEVHLGQSRDAFVFVRDAQGRSGWMERAALEPIVPPA